MTDALDTILNIAIPCPECGEEIAAKIGTFKAYRSIPCPHCDTRIDLTNPRRQALIHKLAEATASVIPSLDDVKKAR